MTRRLLLLNGLAVLGVAIHHAAAYGFSAMFLWTNRYRPVAVPNYDQLGSLSYYGTLLIRQLDSFAIPAFLFVSGFFIAFAASGSRSNVKWNIATARIKVLLVPFIIWTIVFYVMLRQVPSSVRDILQTYYYIPLVCQYYLLSPFLVPIAKTRWKTLLVVTALIQLGVQSLRYLNVLGVDIPGLEQLMQMTPIWFFPARIFYFTFGIVVGFHISEFKAWFYKYRWALFGSLVALAILTIVEYEAIAYFTKKDWLGPEFTGIARTLYAFIFIVCFLAFDKISIIFSKNISNLGTKSLGVYLVNTPAIYFVASIMYKKMPWMLGYQILYQIVLIIVGIAIPLLLMSIVSKSPARGVYRYLFG